MTEPWVNADDGALVDVDDGAFVEDGQFEDDADVEDGVDLAPKDPWPLIANMMSTDKDRSTKTNSLVNHQIESMNDFYTRKIGLVLAHYSRSQIEIGVRFEPTMVVGNVVRDMLATHPGMLGFRRKLSIHMDNHLLGLPTIEETTGHRTDMMPNHARLRNLTYSAPLHVDVHLTFEHVNDDGLLDASHRKTIKRVLIGRVPIMVGSIACRLVANAAAGMSPPNEECRMDPRGYFIVNGQERVVLSADRIADNWPLIFASSRSVATGFEADIRSAAYDCLVPQKLTLRMDHTKHIKYGRPMVALMRAVRGGREIPLYVLFRALGVESDAAIQRYILCGIGADEDSRRGELERLLQASAKHAADETGVFTREGAREWLRSNHNTKHHAKRFGRDWVAHPVISVRLLDLTLDEELLPHCGPDASAKAMFLGAMALKLLRVTQKMAPPDNRDTYLNKRVETPGAEFTTLFRTQFNKMVSDCVPRLKRMMEEIPPDKLLESIDQKNINLLFKPSIIEKALEKALATGNFGSNKMQIMSRSMMGMSQIMNRMNYMATLSHLRRFMSHIERNGKMVAPRKLDVSHYGIICMSETPEGAQVGIVKNMSVSCYVTQAHNPEPATTLLAPFIARHPSRRAPVQPVSDVEDSSPRVPDEYGESVRAYLEEMGASTAVYFNGALLGHAPDPRALVEAARAAKRAGVIPPVTSIVWRPRDRMIKLSLEAGRPCRPLFVVNDGRLAWRGESTFAAAVLAGQVEWMDPEETAAAMIAMTPRDLLDAAKQGSNPGQVHMAPRYTHAEIHPCMALGVLANNIPFSNCNQSPRNVYQCLAEDEPVLMADGAWRPIKDVRVGDAVATFDPSTHVAGATKVTAHLRAPTDKAMVEIQTAGGRAVRLTVDHRVFVHFGAQSYWMEAGDLGKAVATGKDVRIATFVPPTPDSLYAELGFAFATRGFGSGSCKYKDLDSVLREGTLKARSWLAGVYAYGSSHEPTHGSSHGLLRTVEQQAQDHDDVQAIIDVADCGAFLNANDELDVRHAAKGEFVAKTGLPCTWHGRDVVNALAREAETFRGEDPERMTPIGDALFVPVLSVTPCPTTMICDIEVNGGTHCFIAGRGGGFGVHNSAMGKQAMGVYATSYRHRLDCGAGAHLLHTTQRPLVGTRMASLLGVDTMTNGINVTVLIGSMSHNQEDAVVINKAAVQRGLFVSSMWKTHRDRVLKNFATGEEEVLTGEKPDALRAFKHNYGKLGENGLPPLGATMVPGDVLVGKVMRNKVSSRVVPTPCCGIPHAILKLLAPTCLTQWLAPTILTHTSPLNSHCTTLYVTRRGGVRPRTTASCSKRTRAVS